MVNPELHTLHDADGHPVTNVSFDLSADQLASVAHVVEAVRLERHRDEALSTDDVLALRELTSLSDQLHGLAEQRAHAGLLLTLGRFAALHDALSDWVHAADERGWMRDEDREHHARVAAMLEPMAQLRAEAVRSALGQRTEAPGA